MRARRVWVKILKSRAHSRLFDGAIYGPRGKWTIEFWTIGIGAADNLQKFCMGLFPRHLRNRAQPLTAYFSRSPVAQILRPDRFPPASPRPLPPPLWFVFSW
jgi:hypothetical protein